MNRQNVPHLRLDEKYGYWRYERRVPKDLQQDLGKWWKKSLGPEAKEAERKATLLRVEHDQLIVQLRDPAGRREWLAGKLVAAQVRTAARFAELEAQGAPDGADDQDEGYHATPDAVLQNMWRQAPAVLADDENPEHRARRLAGFQALAFGDFTHAEIPNHVPPPRPAGVDGMMFDAYRSMTALAVDAMTEPKEEPKKSLSAMMDAYLIAVNARPQTVRHYRQMVRKLVETFQGEDGGGDRPLPFYTKARMQQHRDRLKAKDSISTQTVEKAFAPLKALWKWAADEYEDLTDLVFPPLRLPRRENTIEETRWKAFTSQELKLVWQLLSKEWGPDSTSRLSPARRADFLFAVRIMLWTGLRPTEVFRLTPDNVEQDTILRIRETKTASRRIPISKHLSDLPAFLRKGGFNDCRKSATIAGTFSDNFREIVRPHITDDRKVTYSLKDCLVTRLTPIADDNVIRAIIGHKDKSKLRHYREPLGETEEGRAMMKRALDRITYW